MDKNKLLVALNNSNIEWRKHALERMLTRGITRAEVKSALMYGEIIEEYKDDKPYESALFFYVNNKPLNVVVGFDIGNMMLYVITAYIPDKEHFNDDFKTRRRNDDR